MNGKKQFRAGSKGCGIRTGYADCQRLSGGMRLGEKASAAVKLESHIRAAHGGGDARPDCRACQDILTARGVRPHPVRDSKGRYGPRG